MSAHEGTRIALSAWGEGGFTDATSSFGYLDRSFADSNLAKYARGEKGLSTFFLVVMLTVPPLALIVGYYVVKAVKVFARALLGFALALTGIAFLIVIFSLFLGLALFRVTQPFFEKMRALYGILLDADGHCLCLSCDDAFLSNQRVFRTVERSDRRLGHCLGDWAI